MAKALVLTAVSGTQPGRRHIFTARVNTIGSAASSDLVLHERQIEPRHVELRQVLERWFVVPLSPEGRGISLNGAEVRSQSRLNPGDVLTIGVVTYSVGFEEQAERAVGSAPAAQPGVPRLGEYFLRRGIMSREQIERAAQRQAELLRDGTRLPFGRVAYDMGFVTRAQLDAALADQRGDFNDRFLD